jgi:hypothetical protein
LHQRNYFVSHNDENSEEKNIKNNYTWLQCHYSSHNNVKPQIIHCLPETNSIIIWTCISNWYYVRHIWIIRQIFDVWSLMHIQCECTMAEYEFTLLWMLIYIILCYDTWRIYDVADSQDCAHMTDWAVQGSYRVIQELSTKHRIYQSNSCIHAAWSILHTMPLQMGNFTKSRFQCWVVCFSRSYLIKTCYKYHQTIQPLSCGTKTRYKEAKWQD